MTYNPDEWITPPPDTNVCATPADTPPSPKLTSNWFVWTLDITNHLPLFGSFDLGYDWLPVTPL